MSASTKAMMTTFTQVIPRTPAIWFFIYCAFESSTLLPATSCTVP